MNTRSRHRHDMPLILALAVLLATAAPLAAQVEATSLDALVDRAASAGFEGVVLVADRGEVTLQRALGHADAEREVPLTPDTRFAIASITKLFTAIAVLQLVDEGRLELDDTLSELLPELAVPGGGRITVHHLLLHISGLPDESDAIYSRRVDPADYARETLERPSGTFGEFDYANVDYVLLGLIVSRVDGEPWASST